MNKRLLKRHKRQVLRAKEQAKLSEPDLRTPEQVREAREASGAKTGRRNDTSSSQFLPSIRKHSGAAAHSAAKADA